MKAAASIGERAFSSTDFYRTHRRGCNSLTNQAALKGADSLKTLVPPWPMTLRFGKDARQNWPGLNKPVLLVLDLDKSLLKWKVYNETLDETELQRVATLIQKYRKQVTVVLNTGRSPIGARQTASFLRNFPVDYLILYDGKILIPKQDSERPTDEWLADPDTYKRFDADWQKRSGWSVAQVLKAQWDEMASHGFKPVTPAEDPAARHEMPINMRWIQPDAKPVHLYSTAKDFIGPLLRAEPAERRQELKKTAERLANGIVQRMQRQSMQAEAKVYEWLAPWGELTYCFLPTHRNLHKSSPLAALTQMMRNPRHVITVGDNGNDREMMGMTTYPGPQEQAIPNTAIFHDYHTEQTLRNEVAGHPDTFIIDMKPDQGQSLGSANRQMPDLPTALAAALRKSLPEETSQTEETLRFSRKTPADSDRRLYVVA